jgi:hypothetical protein
MHPQAHPRAKPAKLRDRHLDVPTKLPYVSWGDSEKAKVGDWVVAVGNPFGLGGTVTAGIISALGRDINEGPYDDFIQIDAPINRGNSGGPSFDLSARVIGINTAIYSPSGGSVGIGFAVPSSTAKNVVAQLREHGHVTRGWLGVAVQSITPTIAKSLGLDPDQPKGALVASVTPNSPAAKAGIKQGDVILSANGHPIKTVHELPRLVAATPIGQKLDLDPPQRQGHDRRRNDRRDEGKPGAGHRQPWHGQRREGHRPWASTVGDRSGAAPPIPYSKGGRGRRCDQRRQRQLSRDGRHRARRCHRPGRPEAGENPTAGCRGTEASRGQRQHSAAAEPPGKKPVCGPVGGSYRINHAAPMITRSKKDGHPSVAEWTHGGWRGARFREQIENSCSGVGGSASDF